MKFRTLSNREVRMDIRPERYPVRSRDQSKSHGQYMLGRLLRSIYGQAILLEEFPIPEERLYLDFYMPHHNLAFEYHGRQHDEFNAFFHTDKAGFQRSQARDARKENWCKLNTIVLVAVRENVSAEDLQRLIEEARSGEHSG